nr:oligosaccharide flippase family protein [Lysobacter daejeonensis]
MGKPPPPRPDIATHYIRYSVTNGAVMLLGFISFPILTRFLDNTEFGILRYYDTLMLLGVALIKFGAPHAIVRFYPYEGGAAELRRFGTNFVMMAIVLSVAMWAVLATGLVVVKWSADGGLHPLLLIALTMIPLLAVTNIVQMVMRASERSDTLMSTRIIARFLELVFVLGAVVLVQQSALSVYAGKVIAIVLVLGWLAYWMYRNVSVSMGDIDVRSFRNGLLYGVPLMANELSASVLANMDRVLIKHITGDFSMVGIYAIGYALAMQLNVFINATLSEAFTPVVMRTYEAGGSSAVRELKARILHPMTYAVTAIVAMLLVSGEDLLIALSGRDKSASGEVFVVVGITISIYAMFAISNYGLQLKKRTLPVLGITLLATALNMGLNFFLIPRMGYMGAAWATAASYAALCILQFLVCPRGLARLPEPRTALIACGCAAGLVAVARGLDMFGLENVWARLAAGGLMFVVLYAIPALALDSKLRATARGLKERLL